MSIGGRKNVNLKKIFFWINDKKNYLFSALAIVVLIGIVIQKSSFISLKKSKDEVVAANDCFRALKESSFGDEQKLYELKNIIKKHPSLKSKYDGIILQNLIISGKISEDEYKMAETLIERTRGDLPYYNDFSKAAILISKNHLDLALKESIELKEKMLRDESFFQNNKMRAGSVLFSLNLFRIACLEGKLNHSEKELIAWNDLENFINSDSKNGSQTKETYNTLNDIFKEKEIELIDYIEYRKNQISSIKS